ncbi:MULTISPECIES: Vms1/Ankzf1 family peptidyl-tRNA hydrolase [Nonomuraea]|uniref:Vms1/Ankzf1 family peptidyl-tRNA hydrolase n=1 Tax=Nonomuraea mangrovi TaxID=2316207 RepID=A0ABW4SSN2_9ACTN
MRLDFIRPLYERHSPYASLYLAGLSAEAERRRWRSFRESMEEADQDSLDALEAAVAVPAPGRALFATGGEVVLAETLADPPRLEQARWSPLPHVTPLLMARGENVPHLRVVLDRDGVELMAFGGGSPRVATEAAQKWPLQRTAQGGWSRKSYKGAVDESSEHDAETVAHEVDEQVRRISAELVVVAGEPRSRSLLCDHLGTKAADRVMMAEQGSRADHDEYEHDVECTLDAWLEQRRSELLDRRREHEEAVGFERVARLLREGRVHAVLSPGELPDLVWIGAGGTQLSADADELRRWGVESPVRERADSAIARAAAMTDAELWFSPEVKQVSAVIRY